MLWVFCVYFFLTDATFNEKVGILLYDRTGICGKT